jgi:hypothetical protein
LKEEHEFFLFEENAEDFLDLEENVLGIPTKDYDEDFVTVEALHYTLEVYVAPRIDDYS